MAVNLLEGEVNRGVDGYEYVISSHFADGSSRVKCVSDGVLVSLKAPDSITLVSESPVREALGMKPVKVSRSIRRTRPEEKGKTDGPVASIGHVF